MPLCINGSTKEFNIKNSFIVRVKNVEDNVKDEFVINYEVLEYNLEQWIGI